jgi:hypothetical protein
MYAKEISEALTFGKRPKLIRSNLVSKYGSATNIPTLQQIRTRRAQLVKMKESKMGMKYLTDVSDFISDNLVSSREAYMAKGRTELIVLGRHSTKWTDDITCEDMASEGFVYSCRDLLDNMLKQIAGCGDNIAMSLDTTFNLVTNGWCLYSCGCRTLNRQRSGKITQQYRPFCYLLSRTERGDGYQEMLRCLATVRAWQGVHNYDVKATCSDHHDGLIKAVKSELPNGEFTAV